MGKIQLNKMIMNSMDKWGANFDSDYGDQHNPMADKLSPKINSKDVTLNKMSDMDSPVPKPKNMNPGIDMGFLNKGNPIKGTVGEGLLTRKCQD